jgi:hypothetical protein
MNIISDYEAHRRDEAFDAAEDRRKELAQKARERRDAQRLNDLERQCGTED